MLTTMWQLSVQLTKSLNKPTPCSHSWLKRGLSLRNKLCRVAHHQLAIQPEVLPPVKDEPAHCVPLSLYVVGRFFFVTVMSSPNSPPGMTTVSYSTSSSDGSSFISVVLHSRLSDVESFSSSRDAMTSIKRRASRWMSACFKCVALLGGGVWQGRHA